MVTEQQAYEWVKTGHWSLSEFKKWVDRLTSDSWADGRAEGYDVGYDQGYSCGAND